MAENSLAVILQQAEAGLRVVAPNYVNVQRLTALAIEARMRNPLLADCSPESVLNFCKKCAEAGTDRVGAGGMWPVPFRNSKTGKYDMTPIPDWRLLIERAKKAKAIRHATAEAVREGDEFAFERGLEPRLTHVPRLGNTGKPIAVYCPYILPDGTKDFVVMDWETEVLPIRNKSKAWIAYKDGKVSTCPWAPGTTDEIEMGKKTVVKRAMKLFEGASIELSALLDMDNSIFGYATVAEVREPISMPKELPPPAPPAPEEKPKAPAPEPEQPKAEDGSAIVVGFVEKVLDQKKGKTEWFEIVMGGEKYSTFDPEQAGVAKAALADEVELSISYIVNAKGYRNVKSVGYAIAPDPTAGMDEQAP